MKLKSKILLFVILILLIFFILFVITNLSVIDRPTAEKMHRIWELRSWENRIKQFEKVRGKLPESLYEAYWLDELAEVRFKVKLSDRALNFNLEEKVRNPQIFFEEVEYALFINQQKWFVLELNPGMFGEYRLMIDQDRRIFEIRETGTDK